MRLTSSSWHAGDVEGEGFLLVLARVYRVLRRVGGEEVE